jgi:hypothetical protein
MSLPQHEHVLGILDIFEDDDAYYVTMQRCHGGELFELLASMDRPDAAIDSAGYTLSRPMLTLTACAHPTQRLQFDVTPQAVKRICKSLEDLLCPEAKSLWQQVIAEASLSAQSILCDTLELWQKSHPLPPLATQDIMEWTFPDLGPEERCEAARKQGWQFEPPQFEEITKLQSTAMKDWADLPCGAMSDDGDDDNAPLRREDASDASDGAQTEVAEETFEWQIDDLSDLEDVPMPAIGGDMNAVDRDVGESLQQCKSGKSEAGRSLPSASQRQSSSRTRRSEKSQMQSSITASGYKMHAVSSRSMGSASTNQNAGQDFEEIGAQSILEFFRNPTFLEAVLRAFLKMGRKEAARTYFVRLLALITTDGLLEEERCKEETRKAVFIARLAVHELLAIVWLMRLESEHKRIQGRPWGFQVYLVMHYQNTAIASLCALLWLREDLLAHTLPQTEAIERMSSSWTFLVLQNALQRHPQQGEEVLAVLQHMLTLLAKDLVADECDVRVQQRITSHEDDWRGRGQSPAHEEAREEAEFIAVWEKKKAELEKRREDIRSRIASMLIYLIAAHELALQVLEFLHEADELALCPVFLNIFVVGMLGAISTPFSERIAWAVARFLVRPAIFSLLESDGSDDICGAVDRFRTAYDDSLGRERRPSDVAILRKYRDETDERIRQLEIKLRDILLRKSCAAGAISTSEPSVDQDKQMSSVKKAAETSRNTKQAAAEQLKLASWFFDSKRSGTSTLKRASKAATAKKPKKRLRKRQRVAKESGSDLESEELEESAANEKDDDEDEDFSFDEEDEYDPDAEVRRTSSASGRDRTSASLVTTGASEPMSTRGCRKPGRGQSVETHRRVREGKEHFVVKFEGVWSIYVLKGDTQRIWGQATVHRKGCFYTFPSAAYKDRPFRASGEGTKEKPFVIERDGASLEKEDANSLTWVLRSGAKTRWVRETDCSDEASTPPTPAPLIEDSSRLATEGGMPGAQSDTMLEDAALPSETGVASSSGVRPRVSPETSSSAVSPPSVMRSPKRRRTRLNLRVSGS